MHPIKQHPTVVAIIGLAAGVFLFGHFTGHTGSMEYGVIPLDVKEAWTGLLYGETTSATFPALLTTISALFLHGSPEHLIMNMVFLWMFGALASQHLGRVWALVAFFLCGIGGSVLHIYLNSNSSVPCIGASGAVAGLGGIYFGLMTQWPLPWPEVWPLAHPVPPTNLAIFSAIGIGFDLWGISRGYQGIAYAAHIGGFATGLILALIITNLCPSKQGWTRFHF